MADIPPFRSARQTEEQTREDTELEIRVRLRSGAIAILDQADSIQFGWIRML